MSTNKDQCITELNKTLYNQILKKIVKDPFKSKYHLLIIRREDVGIKKLKIQKAFIDCLQTSDDVLKIVRTVTQQRKEKREQCLFYDRRYGS